MKRSIVLCVISFVAAAILFRGGVPQPVVSAANNVVTASERLAAGVDQNGLISIDGAPQVNAPVGPVYYRTFGAYEFLPVDSDMSYEFFGAALYAWELPLYGLYFRCPVVLPNGAQITQIRFYVIDNSVSEIMTLQLYQTEPGVTYTQSELASVTTSGLLTTSTVQTIVINGAPIITIDNSRYTYFLSYPPALEGAAHMFVGARIEYQVPTGFLPAIMR